MVAATSLMAQGPGGPRGFGGHANSLTPPTAAEMVQWEVNHLTKFFSLTPAQVTAVSGFLTTEQTCLAANSTNLQTARQGLVSAIKTGNPPVSTAVTTLNGLQGDQELCRATAAAAIYGQLTGTQQMQVGTGLGPLMGGGGGFGPPHGGH